MVSFPFDKCIVLPNEFNLEEVIRRKLEEGIDEEPLVICDVSDLLTKYKTWTEYFPRVTPFFGAIEITD